MASKLPDAAARRRAATDFGTNLVVLAGAGTGKTSLLVERALNAIGSGVAEMNQIGAITFTEKAAGELRERLAMGLDRLRLLATGEKTLDEGGEADRAYAYLERQPEVGREKIAARALAAMEHVDGGTVTTIHGFCAELLRSHPVESGVDPGFLVDNGEWADKLVQSTWSSFIGCELGNDPPRPELWNGILSDLSLRQVTWLAERVAGFDVPLPLLRPPWSAAAADDALKVLASELADPIARLLERQEGMSRVPLEYFELALDALHSVATGGLDGFRDLLRSQPALLAATARRNAPKPNPKLTVELHETAMALGKRAHKLLGKLVRTDDETARALLEAAAPFAEQCREQYLRQGFVSFDGLLALARDLLREFPEVRRRLKRRYRLLLVDEFQDTDPLQYEIVLFLAEIEGDDAEESYAARLEPGRLFVVGDAKQSIYRFRGADFGAYRRAVDRIVEAGGERLDLVANFRSVPGVTDPINTLFEDPRGIWHASAYQPAYVSIEPVREAVTDAPRVELWSVELPEENRNARAGREAEGRLIAEAIERWVDEGRYGHRQITILFRALTQLDLYLRPLRARGIPFIVDGGKDFLERPEVSQLMATLKALSQPNDQPALLAFLRSPAGAVSDVELAAYATGVGRWNWKEEVDAGRFPGVSRCFALLADLDRTTRPLSVDATVRRVLERTAMLPLGAAAFEGAQRVANLQKLASAAGGLARDGRLSLEEVVEALCEGKLEEVKTDRPLADDAACAVRISTIHRMKGLENDCVIVPDLAREKSRPSDAESVDLTTLPDGRQALAVKLSERINSPRLWHELENDAHERAEEVRVLYVALTRAKEHLVLLARPGKRKAPWIDALAPWGYDAGAPPSDGATIAEGRVLHRQLAPASRSISRLSQPLEQAPHAVATYERAVAELHSASRAPFSAPSASDEDGEFATRAKAGDRELALAVGLVVHRSLEAWTGRAFSELESHVARAAEVGGGDSEAVKREAMRIVDPFAESDLAERFRTLNRLGNEIPLLMRDTDGRIFRGSIDLLYREDDGTVVVADYKTDTESDEGELIRRHGAQLRIYARAAQRALGLERLPRAELWMLRHGKRVVVEPD